MMKLILGGIIGGNLGGVLRGRIFFATEVKETTVRNTSPSTDSGVPSE